MYGIDAKQSNLQERNIFKEIENISFMTFTAFTNTQSPLNTHICAGHLSRRPKIYISYMSRTHHIITIVSTIFFYLKHLILAVSYVLTASVSLQLLQWFQLPSWIRLESIKCSWFQHRSMDQTENSVKANCLHPAETCIFN